MEIQKRNPKIYIMCGKAKHGKDTFSAYLRDVYKKNGKEIIVTQLSKYIKYYAREMTGWDLSEESKASSSCSSRAEVDSSNSKIGASVKRALAIAMR